jgi:acetyl-CoA carboxylase biotin carboxyl carrier protein
LDIKELKEILQILDENEIAEFELEEEGRKLRIRKAPSAAPQVALPAIVAPVASALAPSPLALAPPPAAPAAVSPPPAAPEKEKEAEEGLFILKSPIVGTFYRAPDPSAPPFVNVGDHVKQGQVLCIVEAMKLMNEIEAEAAGQIVKVHPENGQPVQYGEPLFTLRLAK